MESLLRAVLAVLFLGLFQQGAVVADRPYTSELTVPNGQRWGTWRGPEMCPDQYFAIGFRDRVERSQGKGDDTSLNGIRLICSKDGDQSSTTTVQSHPGPWGDWSQPQYCASGVLTSFQLRVEGLQGNGDNTAANNIRFRCSNGHVLEGSGLAWGQYGQWSQDCVNGGICGIETKVEAPQGEEDDTALNDVRFRCCARAQKLGPSFLPHPELNNDN
ncbi:vitelline membrane outer layer protein 1 homolog isoform X2 [Platichthys flesus]|uniref:vitelline membrane outer layer protein 1 homolog isoform X2 n=1 Tax=Platichthys flesus TaxID=8260 RepID=UPI002DBB5A62|nr:vitelline membrane outer layer protein 1 homolog isoform X2 [Platichthys flesus]